MTCRHPLGRAAALIALAALLATCRSGDSPAAGDAPAAPRGSMDAWGTVYGVLQHPRCVNCHPAGDVPLQGDRGVAHAQNVQRGPAGQGLYAMRCSACHQSENAPGAHLPPGAPHWQLPRPDMPLVFEGLNSAELCRQLADPARNGGRTPEQLLHHVAEDALVRWGWSPGEGRAPVPVPHDAFVAAMRAWVESGCACPE